MVIKSGSAVLIAFQRNYLDLNALHDLTATGLNEPLLINFGKPSLEYRRMVLTMSKKKNNPQISQIGADYVEVNRYDEHEGVLFRFKTIEH